MARPQAETFGFAVFMMVSVEHICMSIFILAFLEGTITTVTTSQPIGQGQFAVGERCRDRDRGDGEQWSLV